MNMAQRLQRALDARGRDGASLLKQIGGSKGRVYNILNGTTTADKVTGRTVTLICDALQISRDWLLTGVGDMDAASTARLALPAPAYSHNPADFDLMDTLIVRSHLIRAVSATIPGAALQMTEALRAVLREIGRSSPQIEAAIQAAEEGMRMAGLAPRADATPASGGKLLRNDP